MGNKHDKIVKRKEILQSIKLAPSFKGWKNEDEAKLNNIQKIKIILEDTKVDIDIKSEDTKLGWQATMEKIKIILAINSINVDELNYLEEKVCSTREK